MTSILTRPVGLVVLAILVYAVTLTGLFLRSQDTLMKLFAPPVVVDATEDRFVYWGFRTNEINKLINDLRNEKLQLQERADQLAMSEARLVAERKELEHLREEIERHRQELSNFLVEVKQDDLKNLRTEVAILANMAPQNVVAIFREKSDQEVVKLLSQMKADAIAPIMESMMLQEGDGTQPSARRAARLLNMLQRLKESPK